MIHLRLSDPDRERLGVPVEWLDVDAHSVTAREAAILQRGFDLDGMNVTYTHPGEWRRALAPGPDAPPEFPALLVLLWLGLRRAGITVDLAALDFDVDQLAYRGDGDDQPEQEEADPEASPGKDDEPGPPPNGSEPSETSSA